jgi:AmmeMemoRadiSam system protein A
MSLASKFRPPVISDTLSNDDKSALLKIARQSLTERILHGRYWTPEDVAGTLAGRRGAFVTLELRGKLRGCVGHVESRHSLAVTVSRCAIAAALEDDRFNPVSPDEAPQLTIEISVLSVPKVIALSEIEIGRHGLIIERGPFRGLLLPQVASERNWTAERFLADTCRKAGLPGDAWKSSETRILGFSADVFSESSHSSNE